MSPSIQSAAGLRPLLEECGYTGARLESCYRLGDVVIPLVGFASSERDMDSACIAVVDGGNDPESAVRSCSELAAPVVWVRHNDWVDWWIQKPKPDSPKRFQREHVKQFATLVQKYKEQLNPVSIYQSRTLARVNPSKQLDFVDLGLLPLARAEAGKKLHDTVESMIAETLNLMGCKNPNKDTLRDIFTSVFRMLAGKIFKDKGIPQFQSIELNKPKAVLRAVAAHYEMATAKQAPPASGYDALKAAAELLASTGSFAVVSPESLAYVYEHTLVTKDLRKQLGIHATPPWLVDYMVWQLYDWIREIPIEDRHVFEPACGHAPFLLSMMRLLRMELDGYPPLAVHDYLQTHIHGIEIDDFAREIARLSLTLADIPNPNGWDLRAGDMFASDMLIQEASRCRILLANPPYELFGSKDRVRYAEARQDLRKGKAVEVLYRAIQHLPPGAAFSVVVPQGVLHNTDAKPVRDVLLRDFDLREICLFADKVFEEGEPESVVLIGRRRREGDAPLPEVRYRRVRESGVADFTSKYIPNSEFHVPVATFRVSSEHSLHSPDLPNIWSVLRSNPRLDNIADVGQGFSFAKKGLVEKARRLGNKRTSDSIQAFIDGHTNTNIWEVPKAIWISPTRTPIQPWRSGRSTGTEQVLVNYVRAMRGPWRLKAFLDNTGCAASNSYNVVRPKPDGPPALFLWAILNSPIANAYVYCHTMQKHNYDSLIASIPVPLRWRDHVGAVMAAASAYYHKVDHHDGYALQLDCESEVRDLLLALDAEVLRSYSLPVRLERMMLDLFDSSSYERKGIGCKFGKYYPAEFKSLLPLHKFISSGYRNSTIGRVSERFKPSATSDGTLALRAAVRGFGDDPSRSERYVRAAGLLSKWAEEPDDFDARIEPRVDKALKSSSSRHNRDS